MQQHAPLTDSPSTLQISKSESHIVRATSTPLNVVDTEGSVKRSLTLLRNVSGELDVLVASWRTTGLSDGTFITERRESGGADVLVSKPKGDAPLGTSGWEL